MGCKRVISPGARRRVSRIVISLVLTPGAFAERSIIRVGYRNKVITAGQVLRLLLMGKTELTRPNRFAGHTFLRKEVSLARTRSIVSLVETGASHSVGVTLGRLSNGLSRLVSSLEGSVLSILTRIRIGVSCPRCSSIRRVAAGLLGRGTVRVGRHVRRLLGATSRKGVVHRKLTATLIKHPGINGSDLLGRLLRRSGTVIASITNAAHSIVRRCIGISNIPLGLVSATNVERASSGIRGVKIRHSGGTVRRSSLILLILGTTRDLAGRSLRLVELAGSGGQVVVLGGASLRRGLSHGRLTRVSRGTPICTASVLGGRNIRTLRRTVSGLFFGKVRGSRSAMVMAGTQRVTLLGGTRGSLSSILRKVDSKVPISLIRVSVART